MDGTKNSKGVEDLDNTVNHLGQVEVYRTHLPVTAECTFFLTARGTFTKIDCAVDHEISLDMFKSIQIIQGVFPDNNGIKLETITKGYLQHYQSIRKLNTTFLNNL